MKVIFIGASRFGLHCLEMARQLHNIEIVGIITNEQKFSISYAPEGVSNVLYADFGEYAKSYDIPVYVMKNKMTELDLILHVKAWAPALFLVVGWYHIIPQSLLKLSPAVGLHASLLPDYSGGAPLVWAIINGESKTGITFFQFSDGVDDGPIISQASIGISTNDTIATLYEKIEVLGIALIKEHLPRIADGTAEFIPQDEGKRRIFPQRNPEDGRIDWNQPSYMIHNFIRAQTHPYPGAFTIFGGDKLMIWKSYPETKKLSLDKLPGSFFIGDNNQLMVVCGMQTVIALDVVGFATHDMAAGAWFLGIANQVEGLFP